MLKKLRLKFIIFNMIIVAAMLGLLVGMIYLTTRNDLERGSIELLESVAKNPNHKIPPDVENMRQDYFTVFVYDSGEIEAIDGDTSFIQDEVTIEELVADAVSFDGRMAINNENTVRYLKTKDDNGYIIVFEDISMQKQILRNTLTFSLGNAGIAFVGFFVISLFLSQWAVKPVEKAWKSQRQFIADASHELKTPLTVIMTDTDLIKSKDCTDTDREVLTNSIITMAGQMKGLVESMLELARVDDGSINEIKETVILSEIVSDASMIFEPVFFEKNKQFSYEICPDIKVNGNGVQLKQVVDIFLDNAVKYSKEKGKTILRLERSQHRKCLLTVSNEGDEISHEDLKNLFERFYRLDKARKMNNSYGLGLAIAKSVVEKHSGRIWAESKNGYNSFYMELSII